MKRLAVWLLAFALVLQPTSFLSIARAQEENSSETTSVQDSTQTSTQESQSSSNTSSNLDIQTPQMPSFDDLYQSWLQNRSNDDEEEDEDNEEEGEENNEAPMIPPASVEEAQAQWSPDPDPDEANEDPNPATPPSTNQGSTDGQTPSSSSNIDGTPIPPATTNTQITTENTQWWDGLTPSFRGSSRSTGTSGGTAQSIFDFWTTYWTPTEEKSISTPSAGQGENTGGVVSPASTSTASTTPAEEGTPSSVTPLTSGNETLEESSGTPPTTCEADCNLAEAENSDNTGEGNLVNSDTVQTDTSIETTNESYMENRETIASDSGNNLLEFGGRGEGGITSGGASTSAEGEFQLNTTEIRETGNVPASSCADCWAVWNLGSSASNDGTGEDSQSQATADVDRDFTVVNTNIAYLGNNYLISGNSGRNRVSAGFSFKDGWVETGNVKVRSNIINKVNTNLIDLNGVKAIWRPFVLDVNGEYSGDIDLFELLFSKFGGTRGVSATAHNGNTGKDSLNLAAASFSEDVSITNENTGLIDNDFLQEGVSGQNEILAGAKVKRTTVQTGKVDSVFNLFNFLNTNIIAGEASVIALNIFGNFKGNVLLPDFSQMFPAVGPRIGTGADASASIEGATGDSLNEAIAIATSDTEITVQNFAGVSNEIRNRANSGLNENRFGEDVDNISVRSGKAKSQTNVDTTANLTCIGCGLFTASFNVLGNWLGELIGAPQSARKEGNGKSFVVTVDDAMVSGLGGVGATADASINGTDDDSLNGAVAVAERKLTIKSDNAGIITNKVDALGDTGSNTIASIDGKDIAVNTGDAYSAVNVSSLINTDIIGGKLVKIAVNLFGSWDGDFVIGDPTDLAVALSAAPDPSPAIAGGKIIYTATVTNPADGKETDATVTATYDAAKTALEDAGGGAADSGTVTFTFPALAPGATASAHFTVIISSTLGAGTHTLSSAADVVSSRGDGNNANNHATANVSVTIGSSGNNDNGQNPPDNNGDGNDNEDDDGTVGGATLPGDSGSGGGSGSSGGSVGGGAGSGNGNTATNEYFTITKSNTTPTAGVAPDSTVPFKIELTNNRAVPINDVKVYDKLKNASGIVVFENSWDLEQMAPNEKVVIDYTIIFSYEAPDGVYTNTAYASGFNEQNATIKSPNTSSTARISSSAHILHGSVEGAQGTGGGAGGGTVGSTTDDNDDDNEALATRDSWTPVDAGAVAGDAERADFAEIDYVEPRVKGYETVQRAADSLISRITVPSAEAAGFNPALLVGLDGALQGGPAAGTASLMTRTLLFGLLSFFCLLVAILFARRRKDNEKVHSTPYWML